MTEPERAKTLEAIGTLAQAIIDEAIEADSRLCWLEVDPGSPLRGAVGLTELYRGSSGIAVFLAAASRLLGNQAWGSAACRALSADDDLESRLDSWERGWPGELYARLTVGRLLNNDSLCDDAAGTFAEGLGRRTTDPGALVDVMGGLSGVLAAALSAVEHGSSDLRGASEVLTDELVDVIQRRRTDPLRERQVHRLGFAHGITGLSYVLLRAANVLDHAAASELGAALIGFEEDRIAVRAGVPGWRPNPTTPPARSWCWGVAGYLASRSSPAVQRARRPTARHVDAALDVLESRDRDRSHLCCGEAGHLVALTTAAAGGNERAAEIGGSIIATLAGNVLAGTRCHFYGSASFDAPSLFWGRAGVGYALCHAIAPDVVPNVLLIG